MEQILTAIQPALDNASYVDLFVWTFILLPAAISTGLVVYWVISEAFNFIHQLL